jgi:hypothetical protein
MDGVSDPVEVQLDELVIRSKELFIDTTIDNDNIGEIIVSNEDDRVEINEIWVEDIINNLKMNKAIGQAQVSNEMLKISSRNVIITISEILNRMINENATPKTMNIGKLIPIIKNTKKSNDDITNIRPLTISDSMATIYEQYILKEILKN